MPAADIEQPRAGLPVGPGLLWTGVGLAPVAALLVLLAGDNTGLMRFAVLLAVAAVALIGASLVLRRDPEAIRDQFEDILFEELDVFRDEVREDITTAARATHRAFGERVGTLQESVDSLRGEVEQLRVRVERGGVPPQQRVTPAVPPVTTPTVTAPHGVVRHTETVKVTRQTIVDNNDSGRGTGTVYGASRAVPDPVVPAQRRAERPAGQPTGGDTGESWSERLLRERLAEERRGGGRHDEPRYADDRSDPRGWRADPGRGDDRTGGRDGYAGWRTADPAGDSLGGTGVQAADRWASIRSDDRGQELQVGEWRTTLHTDRSGAELRVEDRWAAVRREPDQHRDLERPWERGRDTDSGWGRDPQRDREIGRHGTARPEGYQPRSWTPASGDGATAGWSAPRHSWGGGAQPALPAAPSEPSAASWIRSWDAAGDPVSERVRPRQDDGYRWSGRDDEERWR